MGNKKAYIAGSLFSDASIRQRRYEKELLDRELPYIHWHNPIDDPEANDKTKQPTAETIFNNDTKHVLESDYIVAELDGLDSGTMFELGIATAVNIIQDHLHKEIQEATKADRFDIAAKYSLALGNIMSNFPYKQIIAHHSDIRQDSKGYEGVRMPYGLNQYVVGALLQHGKIVRHVEDVVDEIKNKEK